MPIKCKKLQGVSIDTDNVHLPQKSGGRKPSSLDRCAEFRTLLHWGLYVGTHAGPCTHWCANARIYSKWDLPYLVSQALISLVRGCSSRTDRPLIKTLGEVVSWYFSLSNFPQLFWIISLSFLSEILVIHASRKLEILDVFHGSQGNILITSVMSHHCRNLIALFELLQGL